MMQIEVGAILNGKVTGLTNFGAFVDIEGGKTGMVHISEVASSYVSDIREHLSLNQEVKVKVLNITADGKISLSIKKALEPDTKQKPNAGSPRRPGNVWQGSKASVSSEAQSFEEMMAKFKQISDDKMTDLKHSADAKHGGGYSRRGGR